MFGGFVFVVVFWPHFLHFPCVRCGCFLMPVFGVVSGFSDFIFASLLGEGFLFGEFDPGSGRTLAACLTHASRTERPFRGYSSGERVSNTWVICPALRDKLGKLGLIPDRTPRCMSWGGKFLTVWDGPAAYQLVGGVMAYQGDDG